MACYFRRLVPGAAHSRYFIGAMADTGIFYVTRTQVSRPDGEEIREPARVTILVERPHATARPRRVVEHTDHKRNARELAPALPLAKRCTKCELDRKASEFYIVTRDGQQRLHSWCKACVAERNAARAADARRAA